MPNNHPEHDVLGLITRRPQRRPLPTGLLTADTTHFTFTYVKAFSNDPDHRPLLGFSDPTRTYVSQSLFPFFGQRVPHTDRSDHALFLSWLGLPPDASDWHALARSGGTRKGDRYELVATPDVTPSGGTTARVLARGLRFMAQELGSTDRLEHALSKLRPGMPLHVQVEADNIVNPAARRILTEDQTPIGWLPDTLTSYLAPHPTDPITARVAQVNSPDVPWHLRLLIDVETPTHPLQSLFETPDWAPVAGTNTL